MTREEARKLVTETGFINADTIIKALEALGLLKLEEVKPVVAEFLEFLRDKYGVIKIEEWPEGLVLWVGGKVVWKSWEKTAKIGDNVTIEMIDSYRNLGSGKLIEINFGNCD